MISKMNLQEVTSTITSTTTDNTTKITINMKIKKIYLNIMNNKVRFKLCSIILSKIPC